MFYYIIETKELIIKKKVGWFGAEIFNLDIKNCAHLNLLHLFNKKFYIYNLLV
jgi:hypothetical protein